MPVQAHYIEGMYKPVTGNSQTLLPGAVNTHNSTLEHGGNRSGKKNEKGYLSS